jgi:hypothetical protein
MNIRSTLLAPLMLAPMLALGPVTGTAGQLSSSQGVFDELGGFLAPKLYFAKPQQGDLYLATVVGGLTYYITPTDLSLEPTPFLADQTYEGSIELPQWDSLAIPPDNYPLLKFVVASGSDPLDARNWVGGLTGLHRIQFKVLGPDDLDEDRDDDGWLDDDRDRDGYHDDDRDRDGYHDDDLDEDGYHDDDLDEDGYHDDDLDEDGFHDDDLDEDGYHDDDDDHDGESDDDEGSDDD